MTCSISETATNVIPVEVAGKQDGTELNLVQRAQQGNEEEAFATLFQLLKARLLSLLADDERRR